MGAELQLCWEMLRCWVFRPVILLCSSVAGSVRFLCVYFGVVGKVRFWVGFVGQSDGRD